MTDKQHLIPFKALFNFIGILLKHGGFHWTKIGSILPWLVKTILLEPFRWIEAIYFHLVRPKKRLESPIFVLGFYRSGTTWMQQLLAAHEDFATPSLFQTVAPEFMLLLGKILKPPLQLASKVTGQQNPYHRLPFDWDFPGEEDVAINALTYPCDFNRIYQYPSYAQETLTQHFGTHSEDTKNNWLNAHRYFLDKIQLAKPNKRIILKSPPNTARVGALVSAYPNAKFVYLHRDPATCMQSYLRLWEINEAFIFEDCPKELQSQTAQAIYEIVISQYRQQKHLIHPQNLIEISYEDFIQNPKQHLDDIYKKFNIPADDRKRERQYQLLQERSDYQPLIHSTQP